MNQDLKKMSQELADQRKVKNMSVAEISEKTKISESFLEKLESGNFDFLPKIYVKSFIKVFSGTVGLDPEVMGRRFDQAMGGKIEVDNVAEPVEEKPQEKFKIPEMDTRKIAIGAIFLLVLLVVVVFVQCPREKKSLDQAETHRIETQPAEIRSAPVEKPETTVIHRNDPAPVIMPDTWDLKATAVETTWMRIVFQDSLADEALFLPGDVKTWSSNTPFYLKVGNGGGLNINLNGKSLGLSGDLGRVANIRVDEGGITRITRQIFDDLDQTN